LWSYWGGTKKAPCKLPYHGKLAGDNYVTKFLREGTSLCHKQSATNILSLLYTQITGA